MIRGQLLNRLAVFALVLTVASPAYSADITLIGSDTLGNSSFNAALNWSNAAAPSAGNNYFTGNFSLRTPASGASFVFGGDSLRVNNTNGYSQGLFYKGTGNTGIITINNLILDGGFISHGNGTGDLFQLAGSMSVVSPSTIYAKQGHINISAPISGTGNLTIAATDDNANAGQRIVTLQGASTLSGNIDVLGKLTLANTGSLFFDINGPGVNNAVTGTGVAVYNGTFNFDLTGAPTTPGSSWTISSVATQTYGPTFAVNGFTNSGDFWSNGTFLFNPLTGVLSVSAPPVAWNVDGGGNWNVGTNWAGNAVPGSGAEVAFGSVLTAPNAPANINLNVNANVSRVSFSGTNQYIISGANTLTLSGLAQVSATAGTHQIGAVITGTAGLTKTGGGSLILSANNTYTGATNVQQGTLLVRNTGAIDGVTNVSAGATLFFDGDGLGAGYNGTHTPDITGAGQVGTSLGMTTETVTFNTAKTYTGQTTVNNGTLQLSGAGTPGTSDGTAATRTLVDGNSSTGKLALSGVAIGNEVLVLEARELAAINATHVTSSGTSSWAGNVKGETGGSQYNIESTSGTLTLNGIISAPDTGARTFVFGGAGNFNLTGKLVDVVSNADGAIVGAPVNALNNVNLIKRGAGLMTIGTATDLGDDFWKGTTTIEAGTLQVLSNGSNAGELRSSTIAVAAGATFDVDHFGSYSLQAGQDLSGGGEIHAQAFSMFGDNLVSPGDNNAGTLTFRGAGGAGNANLTLGSDFFDAPGARGGLSFNLTGATTVGGGVNDLITGINNLTLDVTQYDDNFTPLGTDSPIEVLINLSDNQLAGGVPGSYRLINYTGTLNNVANTSVSFAPQLQGIGQTRQTLSVSTATGGQVNLVVSGSAGNQTWTGSSGNQWNINTAPNWSGASNVYFDLDRVTFNDTAGANDTVDVAANVVPGLVTFNSATSNTYTLIGAGGIVGNADVALTGNVTAVVANVPSSGANNLGDVSLASGTTLQQGNGTSVGNTNINGVVSGAGAVRMSSGQLQLGGNNTYTGVTTVNGGTLLITSATSLGTTAGNTVVNGGTLRANGATYTVNEPITLNGGTFAVGGGDPAAMTVSSDFTAGASGGTIQLDGNVGADGMTHTGNIVGAGPLTANIDGGSTMTSTGNIGNAGALTKTGAGTLALTGTANITSPTTNVNGGNLNLAGLSSTFTLGNGRTLNANATVTGPVIGATGSTISGTGTYAGNVTAQSGSTVRVGASGLPSFTSQFAVDNFQSYALGDVATVASPPWTAHAAALSSDIEAEGVGNQVLSYGVAPTGLAGVSRSLPTDAVINAGEVGTIFFRMNPRTDDPDHSFGLADIAETGGQNFANFEVQVAALQGTTPGSGNFNLAVRNGGTITTVAADQPINNWYNVWLVVDRVNNNFDMYMNTGNGAATTPIATNFAFRNGAAPGPLSFLLGLSNSAPVENGVRYDDVYYMHGEALNNPLAGLVPGNSYEAQTLTVQGDLLLNTGVNLALDILTPTISDTLNVTGNLTAAGTLAVTLNPGAPAPQLGNVFDILDFTSASGAFQSFSLPTLGSGLAWNTNNLLTTGELSVIASAGILGDFDNDGDVDGRDFLVWQRNPGVGNLSDWQANYGAGPLSASTAVPEPSTLVSLASLALLSLSRRRK